MSVTTTAVPFTLHLLHGFRLCRPGGEVLTGPVEQRLLAYLGVMGASHRVRVAGTLWPDATDEHAMASLRTALWRLHHRVPELVVPARETLALDASVDTDVGVLTTTVECVAEGCDEHVDRLLALHGELLPGWYDDWVLEERTRLRELWLHAVELAGTRRLAAGDHLTALRAGLEAVRADPWRESAHRLVARVHQARGNHVAAIRQLEICRAGLAAQGIAPSAQLRRLADTLRLHTQVSLPRGSAVTPQ
jgi:DNA-binding SARP family transcriptional activator